jgi:heat shock protein 4
MNFKNTVGSLKRLLGRPFKDPEVMAIEKKFVNANLVEGERGEVAASVFFANEQQTFTFTELTAMFFNQVKDFTTAEIKVPVTDAVVSCPGWFTDRQRRALIDAASIAGINVLRVIPDLTASALGYGITKTDLPDPADAAAPKPKNVVFVDMGHSSFQVAVTSFVKGKLLVKGSAFDRNLGGRDFDQALVLHFIKEFDKKYKLDIGSSAKAIFRLRTAIEKVKKILSANAVTMLNVECIQDDKDVKAEINRADFEEMIRPMCKKVLAPLQAALDVAGMTIEDIDSVELVGGSTRVPLVKEFIAEFFGGTVENNKLSYTLNQDEAVSRGAALQCAIISPVFKVRDFAVQDWNGYPIELSWDASQTPTKDAGKETVMEAFPLGNAIPSSKILTFYRSLKEDELKAGKGTVDFTFSARYNKSASSRGLAEGSGYHIGTFTLKGIKKLPSLDSTTEAPKTTIKIKTRLDADGILSVEGASQVEELIVPIEEEKAKEGDKKDSAVATPMETAESQETVASPETDAPQLAVPGKTKKVIKKHDLDISVVTTGCNAELLSKWQAAEGEMQASDRLVIDTADRRNALEEYVYDVRSKLEMAWSEFILDADRTVFMNALNEMETWLYGEGEEATKSVYSEKLAQLKKMGDPVAARYLENEERPFYEKKMREYINTALLLADSAVRSLFGL